jgi:hypothetical protein
MKQAHKSLLIISICALTSSVLGQNLLPNGNFELGNTGFTSGYTYSPGSDASQGDYAVLNNPYPWNPGAYAMTDHTSGTGLMLALNGSSVSTAAVWRATVPVQPNTTYSFSAWEASWGKFGGNTDPSPAVLAISINGLLLATTSPSATDGLWGQFGLQWNSAAATQATIEIRDLNTAFLGNDFALDDVSFVSVPEPSSLILLPGFGALVLFRRAARQKRCAA